MELNIHVQVLGAVFVIAAVMGAVANKTNFCTMGAVSDWVNMGDTGRMRSWVLAMAVALAGVIAPSQGGRSIVVVFLCYNYRPDPFVAVVFLCYNYRPDPFVAGSTIDLTPSLLVYHLLQRGWVEL